MSDEHLDELAEAARNRGLKLVRSRVRTPTRRRFGKVGLTDRNGVPIFGMDERGPAAKPEDVENYLRGLGAKDWGASLGVAVMPRKRTPTKVVRRAANDALAEPERTSPALRKHEPGARQEAKPEPRLKAKPQPKSKANEKPKPKPKRELEPPPRPKVRDARPADAVRLVELINYLGHEIDEKRLLKNLKALKKSGEAPLVATFKKRIVGMCGISSRIVIHRSAPLGRITALVVASEAQGLGIGRLLVEAAEKRLREAGCRLVEVTSNDRRTAAHAFYRHMGYERTSIRFAKTL